MQLEAWYHRIVDLWGPVHGHQIGRRVDQNSSGGGIYFVDVVHLKERVLVDIFRRAMRRMKEE